MRLTHGPGALQGVVLEARRWRHFEGELVIECRGPDAFGVFIPAVLKKGFNITHVQDFWQMIAVGAVLIAAVWFDQRRRRQRNSR